jgi:hypothetical protein
LVWIQLKSTRFSSGGVWTHGLALARQALCHFNLASSPLSLSDLVALKAKKGEREVKITF